MSYSLVSVYLFHNFVRYEDQNAHFHFTVSSAKKFIEEIKGKKTEEISKWKMQREIQKTKKYTQKFQWFSKSDIWNFKV